MLNTLQLFPLVLVMSACTELCGEEILKSKPSPDGGNVMIWHSRDCGATTTPKMTVYVVPESETKKITSDNTKIANRYRAFSYERQTFDAYWDSSSVIKVEYDLTPQFGRTGSLLSKNISVGDIQIEYVDITP
ncbi:hypothetical protein [Hellea balneolensis]|uniref:hypothetical protein n=1 Tax=Hellea balneolensis TaxID=287478 RepID=UPI0012B83653|nr:hypothetical protein [Hellea balneolensis]